MFNSKFNLLRCCTFLFSSSSLFGSTHREPSRTLVADVTTVIGSPSPMSTLQALRGFPLPQSSIDCTTPILYADVSTMPLVELGSVSNNRTREERNGWSHNDLPCSRLRTGSRNLVKERRPSSPMVRQTTDTTYYAIRQNTLYFGISYHELHQDLRRSV